MFYFELSNETTYQSLWQGDLTVFNISIKERLALIFKVISLSLSFQLIGKCLNVL